MNDKKMPVALHLKELRLRVLASLSSVTIFAFISFMCWPKIIDTILLRGIDFIFISPQEAFFTRIKVAVICGILLSMPFILYQIWEFIKPALTQKERKITATLLAISIFLLFFSIYFNIFVVTPVVASFFIRSAQPALTPFISVSNYTTFLLNMTVAFAIISQFPLLMVISTMLGIVKGENLGKHRKTTIIAIFILAAIITPPDAFSQLTLALPMCLLYELGLVLIKLFNRL